jgi:hypothetical protein
MAHLANAQVHRDAAVVMDMLQKAATTLKNEEKESQLWYR